MVEEVLEALRAATAASGAERVVALVSGGRDSVCLLDVLARVDVPSLTALHVNYGLRGQESDEDERFVRELCVTLAVPLEVRRAPRPPHSGNLQAWARDLRYARALELALPDGLIATGHTASDQVETVLYRLAASPGRRALLGMAAREGRLIRPLLGVTREQTAEYCRERGLAWREDSSNDDDRFARNRIRGGLLPELRAVHPAAEQNILASVDLLRAEAAVLDDAVAAALTGRDRIALARLAELPPALARLAVIRLAEDAAGRPVGAIGRRFGELLALAHLGGSATLDVGAGVRAVVEYGVLRFERAGPAPPPPPATTLTIPGSARFGPWSLHAAVAAMRSPAPADEHVACFDADRLGSLTVRTWQAGDRIASKTLADLFVDRRIPRAERSTRPVLLSDDRIAWIPGVATAEEFRVRDATRRVAVLTATAAPSAP